MPKTSVKELTKNALKELMNQKPFLSITISDIINTAGIARVSFYRNYHSISDVVDDIAQDMTSHFLSEIYPILSGKNERAWRDFLYRHFYQFDKQKIADAPFLFANGHIIFSRVNTLMQEAEKKISSNSISERYSTVAKMGLINNIVKKWIDEGKKETPEEMIDYIMSFILLF